MTRSIRFIDSYGQPRYFPRTHHALSHLRKRRSEHVIPEVLELLTRIHRRYELAKSPPTVRAEDLGLELNVHPSTMKEVMKKLSNQNVVKECVDENGIKAFTILRSNNGD